MAGEPVLRLVVVDGAGAVTVLELDRAAAVMLARAVGNGVLAAPSPPAAVVELLDLVTAAVSSGAANQRQESPDSTRWVADGQVPIDGGLMTRQQAASYLGVSVRTVDRMVSEGRIDRVEVGRRAVRFRGADLDAINQAATKETA